MAIVVITFENRKLKKDSPPLPYLSAQLSANTKRKAARAKAKTEAEAETEAMEVDEEKQ